MNETINPTLNVSVKEFEEMVSWAVKGTGVTASERSIKIDVDETAITFKGYDGTSFYYSTLPANPQNLNKKITGYAVTGAQLKGSATIFRRAQVINLEFTKNGINATSGRVKFFIPRTTDALSQSGYEFIKLGTVTLVDFKNATEHAVTTTSPEDTSIAALGSVYVKFDPTAGEISIQSTDRYQMTARVIKYVPNPEITQEEKGYLIPSVSIQKLINKMPFTESLDIITEGDRLWGITGGNYLGVAATTTGDPVDFGRILGLTLQNNVTVNKNDLKEAVSAINIANQFDKNSTLIKLYLDEGEIVVKNQENTSEAGVEVNGINIQEPVELRFNPRFLINAIAAINTKDLNISFNNGTTAVMFKQVDETGNIDANFHHVVMPVRS